MSWSGGRSLVLHGSGSEGSREDEEEKEEEEEDEDKEEAMAAKCGELEFLSLRLRLLGVELGVELGVGLAFEPCV
jgi:hypothetical protein